MYAPPDGVFSYAGAGALVSRKHIFYRNNENGTKSLIYPIAFLCRFAIIGLLL